MITHNPAAAELLFEEELLPHAKALYNFAYHLTGSDADADDLVQETYMKAYRFIDNYQVGTNAKAWLFKIMKNGFINDYRKKVKAPTTVDYEEIVHQHTKDDDDSSLYDLHEVLMDGMMGDEVTKAMNQLSDDYRTVIILCDLEEFSYEEIAKIMEVPIGTIRSRLHRARNQLKVVLANYAKSMGFKN
jgi:RNA polymerase sigma factor (sigma-70 family)